MTKGSSLYSTYPRDTFVVNEVGPVFFSKHGERRKTTDNKCYNAEMQLSSVINKLRCCSVLIRPVSRPHGGLI